MVRTGELIERLNDEDASFTRDEVTQLIDWYVSIATHKDISAMRATVEREAQAIRERRASEALNRLMADRESERPTLELKVITYDQA